MEVAGLAIGIAGLAGLASAFRDTVNAFKTYKSFAADSGALNVQWDSQCLRLTLWGEIVGLGADGQISTDHHRRLDDERISSSVKYLLGVIKIIADNAPLQQQGGGNLRKGSAKTRLEKITWTLGGKGDRTEQIKRSGELIQLLHELVPLEQSEGTESTLDEPGWLKDVRQTLTHAQTETRREVLGWVLGQRLRNERFDDSRMKRVPGTCEWILQHPVYTRWTTPNEAPEVPEPTPGVLWIHGRPGFGKTILCSRIVEHLSAKPGNIVGHYFFSSDHEGRDDPLLIARSWLAQLASQPSVYEQICQRWEATDGQVATRSMMMEMMASALQFTPGCFLIIDGLDECTASVNGDNSVGRLLGDILQVATPQTRVLVVSRDEAEIRQALQAGDPDCFIEYQIPPDDVHADTTVVSKFVIDKKLPKKSAEIRANLAKTMTDGCEGQFLWIRLQERNLEADMNGRHLQRVLESIPAGLDQVYQRNWDKIEQSPRSARAVALLRWTAFAVRPLTVGEITEAVLIMEDDDDLLADELPDEIDDDYIWKGIIKLCAPLVEVRNPDLVPESRTVHLTHFTVREFLVSHLPRRQDIFRDNMLLASNELVQNTILARSCLWYIQSRHTWQPETNLHGIHFLAVLRDYARNTWHTHVKYGVPLDQDSETLRRLLDFMSNGSASWTPWRPWMQLTLLDEPRGEEDMNEGNSPEPPYYAFKLDLRHLAISYIRMFGPWKLTATCRGLKPLIRLCCIVDDVELAEIILDEGSDSDSINDWQRTLLHSATQHGSSKIVHMLLARGASVDAQDSNGDRPIDLAATYGFLKIVQSLVEKGADLSTAGAKGMTAVAWAATQGHLEIFTFLAKKGANMTSAGDDGRTPVSRAALNGHFEIIRFSANQGIDVFSPDKNGRTPLLEACRLGKLEVVRFLVERGADVSAVDKSGQTPLFEASSHGRCEVIRLLVDHGADISATDENGQTPLLRTTRTCCGRPDVPRLLVDLGASIATPDNYGWTPLLTATSNGELEVVRVFVDKGADITVSNKGWTPLRLAADNGRLDIVKFLVDKGADVAKAIDDGWSPLLVAAANGDLNMMKFFVNEGAEIAIATDAEWSLLLVAAEKGRLDIARYLVDGGADIAEVTDDGWSPLLMATIQGNLDMIMFLVEKGADITEANLMERSIVFIASRYGHEHVVEYLLLDQRIDPRVKDWCGATPLFAAVANGHVGVAKLLIPLHSSLSGCSHLGRTLLWWACRSGNVEMAGLILRHSDHSSDSNVDAPRLSDVSVTFNSSVSWCDACTLSVIVPPWYHCQECADFYLCGDCFDRGIHCPNSSHDFSVGDK